MVVLGQGDHVALGRDLEAAAAGDLHIGARELGQELAAVNGEEKIMLCGWETKVLDDFWREVFPMLKI